MKTVGDYEYDEKIEIGRGAFGVVYKGRNRTVRYIILLNATQVPFLIKIVFRANVHRCKPN